jgi:hypothetical protein
MWFIQIWVVWSLDDFDAIFWLEVAWVVDNGTLDDRGGAALQLESHGAFRLRPARLVVAAIVRSVWRWDGSESGGARDEADGGDVFGSSFGFFFRSCLRIRTK